MVLTGGEFVSLLTWTDEMRDKSGQPELPRPPATTQPAAQRVR